MWNHLRNAVAFGLDAEDLRPPLRLFAAARSASSFTHSLHQTCEYARWYEVLVALSHAHNLINQGVIDARLRDVV